MAVFIDLWPIVYSLLNSAMLSYAQPCSAMLSYAQLFKLGHSRILVHSNMSTTEIMGKKP